MIYGRVIYVGLQTQCVDPSNLHTNPPSPFSALSYKDIARG